VLGLRLRVRFKVKGGLDSLVERVRAKVRIQVGGSGLGSALGLWLGFKVSVEFQAGLGLW
jgi:hypothetical protein